MREVSRGEHGFGKRSGFRPLTPSEAAFVSALTQRQVRRMRNASIIEPGQTDAPLYTLHQGWAFRYVPFADGSRQIVEFLLPGDLVGLPAAFLPRMIYGVEALTRVELSLHSRETVDRIFAEQPDLAKALVRGLIDDRRRSDFRLAVLGQKQGPHRIAYLLLELWERLERIGLVNGTTCEMPLRRRHWADAAGMSGTHVARSLDWLRDHGLAEVHDGAADILDRDGLASLSGYIHLDAAPQRLLLL